MGPAPSGRTSGSAGLPLVLELHGRGIDPVRFDRLTGFGALADEKGFSVAMPAAIGEIWNDGRYAERASWHGAAPDDIGYLLAVLEDAATRVAVDPRRVYVVGMSNGAAMTGRLACEHPERFAAVAQVAGTCGLDVAARSNPGGPLPLLSIHGTADRIAPYAGGVRTGLRATLTVRNPPRPAIGVDEWLAFWAAFDSASGPTVESLPPDTTIRCWSGATPASDVVGYSIEGAGHTWTDSALWLPPFVFGRTSRTFSATRVIWDFFAAHSRPS